MSEQVDHYSVLGIDRHARQEEVQAAFDEVLAARRARRSKTGDVFAAFAILSQPTLRVAYDAVLFGRSASEKLSDVRDVASEVLPDVHWGEVARGAVQVGLKSTVLVSGGMAKVADVVGSLSRRVQVEAAKRITPPETN